MRALVFPGQGSQFPGMGQDLYEAGGLAREWFDEANRILGFSITETMFGGTEEALRATNVAQPAIFLHAVIAAQVAGEKDVAAVAGHSLGEFSALVANHCLHFEDALRLVQTRANAMQKACEAIPGTMAAVLGLADEKVEQICAGITHEVVVAANYNCPGQLVISGSEAGIDEACLQLKEAGAKRALRLNVAGAFHSPLMEPAKIELQAAIERTDFRTPKIPVYQNVTAKPHVHPDEIRENLVNQLTGAVRWTQAVQQMKADGFLEYLEMGPGQVLTGLIRKITA
jgi:[acyl-carrier-protein] S-malonyltransferase